MSLTVVLAGSACGLDRSSSCESAGNPLAVLDELDQNARGTMTVSVVHAIDRDGGCASATANLTLDADPMLFIAADVTTVGSDDAARHTRRQRRRWAGFAEGAQHDDRSMALEGAMAANAWEGVDARCSDVENTCKAWARLGQWVVEIETLNVGLSDGDPLRTDSEDLFMIAVSEHLGRVLE